MKHLKTMILRRKALLLVCLFLSTGAFCQQHVDEGYYNEWDCGPHGVYGNLQLTRVSGRTCFKIEKAGPGKVVVTKLNPSGTVVKTETVTFTNDVISEYDAADQWGETFEYRTYQPAGDNVFRVTDLVHGKNNYLPCKYAHFVYTGELLTEIRYYSSDGVLKEGENRIAIIRYKRYSDPLRFAEIQETSFFDSRQQPVLSKAAGCHMLVFEYDEHDNKIAEWHRGLQDEPITWPQSRVAQIAYTYDPDNNMTMDEYHGLEGRITSNPYGVSGTRNYYEGGYLMKALRFDSLGNPVRSDASGDGVAIKKYEYDNPGNQVRESFFDATGRPMNNHAGVQEIARFFSTENMLTEISYFDRNGHPCINRDRINTTIYERDDKGRVIAESNYGLNGQPIRTHVERVFMVKAKYDRYGRTVSQSYWADSNTRMPQWDGSYELRITYDENGLSTEYDSFDQDGNPFVTQDGSSTKKMVYNPDGLLKEMRFLYQDKLIDRKSGVTRHYGIIKYTFDENQKMTELTFWAADDKPVDATIWSRDSVSAHRIVFIYNGTRVIEQRYYKLGAQDPFKIADCLNYDYIGPNGVSTGRKNEQ